MQNFSELSWISKKFAKANPFVVDIIIFGSAIKAKAKPTDIDICILTLNKIGKYENFRKAIVKAAKMDVHISILQFKDFLSQTQPLWKTVFHEGISLLRQTTVTELVGFKPQVLFWYSLKKLKAIDKIKFAYALRGRAKQKGILEQLGGEYLGKGTILVPVRKEDEIREFFARWSVPYNRRRILVEI